MMGARKDDAVMATLHSEMRSGVEVLSADVVRPGWMTVRFRDPARSEIYRAELPLPSTGSDRPWIQFGAADPSLSAQAYASEVSLFLEEELATGLLERAELTPVDVESLLRLESYGFREANELDHRRRLRDEAR